jgi:hypothetical protein
VSATATQPLLPDPQAAYDHLFQGVHQRVFFAKLAAAGYDVSTPQQAGDLLKLAGTLRVAQEEQQVKAAAAGTDPYAAALANLEGVMTDAGFSGVKTAAAREQDYAIKQAALDLMGDPDMYNAVLALKAHDADAAGRAA